MEIISWLILAAIFIVIEIATLGLTTIWFAGGAFVAAIVGACGANLVIQIICFVVVSVLLLVITRPIAMKHLETKIQKTNLDAIIGQTAVVLSEINNIESIGKVKVNNMEWTARASEDAVIIPKGATAKVIRIEGVKLIVEKI